MQTVGKLFKVNGTKQQLIDKQVKYSVFRLIFSEEGATYGVDL